MTQTKTAQLIAGAIRDLGFLPTTGGWLHPRGYRLEPIGTAYRLSRLCGDLVGHVSSRKRTPLAQAADIEGQLRFLLEGWL